MKDKRPRPTALSVMSLAPTRAELVRFFAWGYLSRRELNAKLKELEPTKHIAA